jgi:hypothetical protein
LARAELKSSNAASLSCARSRRNIPTAAAPAA